MIQVRQVLKGLLARRDRKATPDPQALRAQRELQVQQDLKVIQAQRERLDRLVTQAR